MGIMFMYVDTLHVEHCRRMLEVIDRCPNLEDLFLTAHASCEGLPESTLHMLAPLKILHIHCFLRAGDLLPVKFLTQLEELSFMLGSWDDRPSRSIRMTDEQRLQQIVEVMAFCPSWPGYCLPKLAVTSGSPRSCNTHIENSCRP